MGFLTNTTTIELIAKLTPQGRAKLVSNTNTLITSFSLGDSDAYYSSYTGLTGGQVPQISGDNAGLDTNNGGVDYIIRSTLNLNASTDKKSVNPASISINTKNVSLGFKTINYSGGTITQNKVALADVNTDGLTNLFYSFGLPITTSDFNNFTGTTGTFTKTAFSGLAQNNILVIGISGSTYAELIDGKSINCNIQTTASTYSIYINLAYFGPNRALLFSDSVLRPNGGDATKSWATGYGTNKPFSVNNKELFNIQTNSNLSFTADTPVGIAYLDKGFLVITEPTIVNDFDTGFSGATGTSITFDHNRVSVSQSITCLADRGEFGVSNNPTWSLGDTPRITEIGLYDNTGTLIAIGKLNKTYYKPVDDLVAFAITIEY
jgi:hypothetical protein